MKLGILKKFILAVTVTLATLTSTHADPILVKPSEGDMTSVVRRILEDADVDDIELVFQKGTYKFKPDYAVGKYLAITNHGNGYKKIIFDFSKFRSVKVSGNGAEFIFHGQAMPFFFEGCEAVSVSDIVIDWDIPFTFLGEVIAVNEEEGWRDIKPFEDGFSWRLRRGKIEFPNVNGFNYGELGSTLAFDAEEKRPVHGAWDVHSNPHKVEKRPNGVLRIYEKLRYYPPVGSLLSSKGNREHDRYAPAFEFKSSSNIALSGITIHHALGMGFLFEQSEDIKLVNSGIYLREGTNRVISTTADATHFANCKGSILIENCTFENMLDDGANVHGTYVKVDQIIDSRTLRMKLMHFEQMGFPFAKSSDEVWFIKQPSPARAETATVTNVTVVNERYADLSFDSDLPEGLKPGDMLENKTWNPEFTMRGCTIRNHRARNVVLKTPLKTVIEDNFFSSMMSSIFFRGETFFWFESGAVNDVLIQNNTFDYCAYSGAEHSVLNITPRLGQSFDDTFIYDQNIRFENNTIRTFDNKIVNADRVGGLVIKGNKIIKNDKAPQLHPDAPVFEFINCKDILLEGNSYSGDYETVIEADKISSKNLTIRRNKGIKFE